MICHKYEDYDRALSKIATPECQLIGNSINLWWVMKNGERKAPCTQAVLLKKKTGWRMCSKACKALGTWTWIKCFTETDWCSSSTELPTAHFQCNQRLKVTAVCCCLPTRVSFLFSFLYRLHSSNCLALLILISHVYSTSLNCVPTDSHWGKVFPPHLSSPPETLGFTPRQQGS